jgi:predicted alpha/beta-hydrolase family hydrolase
MPERVRIDVTATEAVTAIVYPASQEAPQGKRAGISLILAHGAGANQSSRFMVDFAGALAARGIDTVTFNFLYSEQRKRVPDKNDKLELCWRKMIDAFHAGMLGEPKGKLAVGGKSMGGRIASQVAAAGADVTALVLLGYPLHPPGRPDKLRDKHLPSIHVPMLIVQGERDAFGTPAELAPVLAGLKAPVELCVIEGGDHSFKVPKKIKPQDDVYEFVLDTVDRWLRHTLLPPRR